MSYCDPGAQASQVEALKLKQPGVVLLKITGVGVTTVAFCTTVVFITAGASVVWLCTKPEGEEPGHPSANSCLTRPVHEYPTYKAHWNDVYWSASFSPIFNKRPKIYSVKLSFQYVIANISINLLLLLYLMLQSDTFHYC